MRFKRSLGQHILSNDKLTASIVRKAGLRATDTVLEIGPGTGRLTSHLLAVGGVGGESGTSGGSRSGRGSGLGSGRFFGRHGGGGGRGTDTGGHGRGTASTTVTDADADGRTGVHRVVAVERDPRMIRNLSRQGWARECLRNGRLELIAGDALKVDMPHFDVCLANIPFKISSPFVYRLMRAMTVAAEGGSVGVMGGEEQPSRCFRKAIIMVQKEFGDRLTASPGETGYSRLSVGVQRFMDVERMMEVSRGNFVPPPNVDAEFVSLAPRTVNVHGDPEPLPSVRDLLEWDQLLRLCFHRKNKTLRAVLTGPSAMRSIGAAMEAMEAAEEVGSRVGGGNLPRGVNGFRSMVATRKRRGTGGGGDDSGNVGVDKDMVRAAVDGALEDAGLQGERASGLEIEGFQSLLASLRGRGVNFRGGDVSRPTTAAHHGEG
jgi:18S rRNA (adenine1779-N6/adenine1780-N6)-dimethyltransferase